MPGIDQGQHEVFKVEVVVRSGRHVAPPAFSGARRHVALVRFYGRIQSRSETILDSTGGFFLADGRGAPLNISAYSICPLESSVCWSQLESDVLLLAGCVDGI